MRPRRPGRRHHDVRHRRRLREHEGGTGAGRRARRAASRVAGDLHEGLQPHRPQGAQRQRTVAQTHHGVDQRLAHPPGHGLRRPVPGAPVRLRDAARRDDAGARGRRPPGQGPVHRRLRMAGGGDPRRARAGTGPGHPPHLEPAAVQHAVAGHRGGGHPRLAGAGPLADRLVPHRAGRADGEVQEGTASTGGLARHGRGRRRPRRPALPGRRDPERGRAAATHRRGAGPHDGAVGHRVGAVERQRGLRPGGRIPPGADRVERGSRRRDARGGRPRPHRHRDRSPGRARPREDGLSPPRVPAEGRTNATVHAPAPRFFWVRSP